ncbi:MAG: cytochrome c [Dehalococcoidia bacterium]|nr:MAG: cytochrome c [Dehalococcoidia bacterium]
MKDHTARRILVPGLIAVAAMVIATACGGAASASRDGTSQPASSGPGGGIAALSVAPGGAAAASAPVPSDPAAATAADAVLVRGKEIFEKTAGGVGCAACHGMDGKGSSCIGAPANRGADEEQVRKALATVGMMSIVKLTDDEIKAVVAYLAVLGKQS